MHVQAHVLELNTHPVRCPLAPRVHVMAYCNGYIKDLEVAVRQQKRDDEAQRMLSIRGGSTVAWEAGPRFILSSSGKIVKGDRLVRVTDSQAPRRARKARRHAHEKKKEFNLL